MKKLLLVIAIGLLFSSCKKEWDNYRDISATGIDSPICPNAPQQQQQQQNINHQ